MVTIYGSGFGDSQAVVRSGWARQAFAIDWLVSGNRHLYWFGRDHGLERYNWNDCWVTPDGSQWQVRRQGRDNITQPAKTFDETAKICGA